MRIAIYHNLPSGGSKRALFEMAKRLCEHHDMDTYTLTSAEQEFCDIRPFSQNHYSYPFQPSELLKSPFGRLNQGLRTMDLRRLAAVQKGVAADIDARQYDLVFVHHCRFGQSPALLAYLKTPSVYYCAEPPRALYEPQVPRDYSQKKGWRNRLDSIDPLNRLYTSRLKSTDIRNTHSASMILANSSYSREVLYRVYGIHARLCYLGVDQNIFKPLNLEKWNFVLSTGALRPDKGFDFVIRSLALIPALQRPELVLISNHTNSEELPYLHRLAADNQVSVIFKELVTDEELVRAYNQALLTVYAPNLEPFGFVPLESMACGTPVVGVAEGGVRESVLHNQTGYLTDRDPQEFAGAILALLEDKQTRQRFGANSLQHVRDHWTWDNTITSLEKYFHSAVQPAAAN